MNAVAGLGLGLAEVAMDTSTLFGKLTADVPVSDGVATLPERARHRIRADSDLPSEVFGGLLN